MINVPFPLHKPISLKPKSQKTIIMRKVVMLKKLIIELKTYDDGTMQTDIYNTGINPVEMTEIAKSIENEACLLINREPEAPESEAVSVTPELVKKIACPNNDCFDDYGNTCFYFDMNNTKNKCLYPRNLPYSCYNSIYILKSSEVKQPELVKVKARAIDTCSDKDGNDCFFRKTNSCVVDGRYPDCSEKKHIYLPKPEQKK